jgi:hypothetical protein
VNEVDNEKNSITLRPEISVRRNLKNFAVEDDLNKENDFHE